MKSKGKHSQKQRTWSVIDAKIKLKIKEGLLCFLSSVFLNNKLDGFACTWQTTLTLENWEVLAASALKQGHYFVTCMICHTLHAKNLTIYMAFLKVQGYNIDQENRSIQKSSLPKNKNKQK